MRVDSLTAMRFIAALVVVIFHYGGNADLVKLSPGFLTSGPHMVSFFYVLSGYVLVLAYKYKSYFTIGVYFISRLARIYPVYLFALILTLYFTIPNIAVKTLFIHFTMLQAWIPPNPLMLNSPGWSLSVEAFFYVIFPLLFIYINNKGLSWKAIIAVSVALWLVTQIVITYLLNSSFYKGDPSASHDLIYYFPLSHLCSFYLGMSGAYLFINKKEQICRYRYINFSLILILIVNYLALEKGYYMSSWIGFNLPTASSFLSPLYLALIINISGCDNYITKSLTIKPFVVLGEASYSLYILQSPVHMAYVRFVSGKLSTNPSYDFYFYLIMLIIISVTSYYTIEMQAKKAVMFWFDSFRNRKFLAQTDMQT